MKLKSLILLSVFFTSVITVVILSPTASASSAFDNTVHNTETLVLYNPPSDYCADADETQDWTFDWANIFEHNTMGTTLNGYTYRWNNGFTSTSAQNYINTWNAKKYWGVYQSQSTPNSSRQAYIWWTPDPDASASFVTKPTSTQLTLDDHGYPVYMVTLSLDTGYGCQVSVLPTYGSTEVPSPYNSRPIASDNPLSSSYYEVLFIYLKSINYPSDYEGDTPHEIVTIPPEKPEFGYNIADDGTLRAQYLQNIKQHPPHYLNWELKSSNSSWSEIDVVASKHNEDPRQIFQVNSLTPGYYLLRVSLDYTAPFLPPSDAQVYPKSVTFKIDYTSGEWTVGSTQRNDCTEAGVCVASATDCSLLNDIFHKMNCAMQQQLDIGVINPSITAFKDLFISVIVPDVPECSVPLPNFTVIPGKVIPIGQLSSKICSSAQQIRSAFPVIPILGNFSLALALFFLIGRLINKLTDKQQNELVGGV